MNALTNNRSFAAATLFALLASTSLAHAQTVNVGTVQTSATGSDYGTGTTPDSAPYNAPTKAPLSAKQPTSVISQQYIQNNVPASGNYDTAVVISPSIMATAPNGPGLMETQNMTMRGFADGQYNVTFDGIPWGDSNDFTHHTTSYFMAHDLGPATVDRGPGTASTIGTATFGGTIAITSKDPLSQMTLTPYGTVGSFNTFGAGVELDTGNISKFGDTTAFIDAEQLRSDGYLTNAGLKRSNVMVKLQRPVGDNTVLTLTSMYNSLHQNFSIGATAAEIAAHGPNWGASSDPTSQDYSGYNYDRITNDFEYLGSKSILGDGWSIDNKLYTYGYYHHGFNGLDANGNNTATGTPNGTLYGANNVPGQAMWMKYRSVGDLLRVSKAISIGDIDAGMWYDHQTNSRLQYEADMTLNVAPQAINTLANGNASAVDRLMNDTLDSAQPYIQANLNILPGLTLTPGVKYASFTRHIDATVDQKTLAPLTYSKTWSSVLPSAELHYSIAPQWAAYAQVAEGFLAPNLNTFYTTAPQGSANLNPEQTWNYQIGTSYQTKWASLSADAYYIDFSNMINSRKIAGVGYFFNSGGAIYEGVEAEATINVGHGFNVYANGSLNSAKSTVDHTWMPETPAETAAFGVIYNHDKWYASLIDKWVGHRYGDVGNTMPLDPYSNLGLHVAYTLTGINDSLPPIEIKVGVDNLADSRGIIDLAGYTADATNPGSNVQYPNGVPLYWTQAGRSVMVSLSAPIS